MRDTLPIKKKKKLVIDKNLGKLGYERKKLRELISRLPSILFLLHSLSPCMNIYFTEYALYMCICIYTYTHAHILIGRNGFVEDI